MTCTVIRVDNGLPFIPVATLVTNRDGSVSFEVSPGIYAGQTPWEQSNGVPAVPSQYGVRYPDGPTQGAYQRATLSGNTVTFLTRPQDVPCVYLIGQGQAY